MWPQSACMPMHGSCVKLLCVPIAQHAISASEHACIKSTDMQPIVGCASVDKNGFRYVYENKFFFGYIDEVVEVLSI